MNGFRGQVRRRAAAAQGLPPYNERGDRDPDEVRRLAARRIMRDGTALCVMFIGGAVPDELCRELWRKYPPHRPMIEAYATAHREGWAA